MTQRAVNLVSLLSGNIITWDANIPLLQTSGARDKNWILNGETGWVRNAVGELQIDLAFYVTVGDGNSIVTDDIINICWAMQTNNHSDTNVEYEAGVATFFRGAPGLNSSTPSTKWTVTQTLTKVLDVTSSKYVPGAIIPTQIGAEAKVVDLGETDPTPDLYWEWDQT